MAGAEKDYIVKNTQIIVKPEEYKQEDDQDLDLKPN